VSCELEVTDCFGRTVQLDHSNWQKHLATKRHLEVIPYHDQLSMVVADPDFVVEDPVTGAYHFYRLGLTTGRYARHYVKVVVEYYDSGSIGKMKSWRLPTSVDVEGQLVWMRRSGRR
jgi:hypothetical protein